MKQNFYDYITFVMIWFIALKELEDIVFCHRSIMKYSFVVDDGVMLQFFIEVKN